MTMKMLSVRTGVDRANICRFVARLRETGKIFLVKKGLCLITKFRAGYYTTDPAKAPSPKQLKMAV